MKPLKLLATLGLALLLALSGTAGASASPVVADKKSKYYEVPNISEFPADIAKDLLKAEGVKPKFETPDGKSAKPKSGWLVVTTDPAPGELIRNDRKKPKITVIVRKAEDTATGVTKKDTFLACLVRAREEIYSKARFKGGWRVSATDEVGSLKARVEYSDTLFAVNCDVVMGDDGYAQVESFEVIGGF